MVGGPLPFRASPVNAMTLASRGPALRLVATLAAFQASWFACVILAGRGEAAVATLAGLVAVALHFAWSERRGVDARLVGASLAIGFVWDSLLARSGVVDYAAAGPLEGWAPAWILAMWALFAITLREPLRWLHGRPIVAAIFGGIGGPLSYAAAARFGACRFADPTLAMVVLGTGWAVITPALVHLASHLDRGARK